MSRTRPDSGFSENASPPCGTRGAYEDVGRPAGRTLEDIDREEEGFFLDPADWHAGLVEPLASECGIEMSDEHRLVVDFVRAHFEQYESVPEARVLLRCVVDECANLLQGTAGRIVELGRIVGFFMQQERNADF